MEQAYYKEVDGEILPPDLIDVEEPLLPEEPDYEALQTAYMEEVNARLVAAQKLDKDINLTGFAPEDSSSVNLEVRRESLFAGMAMYAGAARAKGLQSFAETPSGNTDLQTRYQGRADAVVAGSNKRHAYTYDDERRTLAPAIGVDAEAWIEQRLPADEEAIALGSLIGIRRAIGKSAGHKNRTKVKKRLERPAA